MTKSTHAVPFPREFHADGEAHPFLRKHKSSLEKSLSLTKMDSLYKEVRLAWFLVALDRSAEALAVAHFLESNVTFTGNHNIWSPIGHAICLEARLLRLKRDVDGRAKVIARLREHPAFAVMSREQLAECLAVPAKLVESAEAPETTHKWALEKLTNALLRMGYFRETAEDGFYYQGWYDLASLEGTIDRTLGLLRNKLNE